MRIININEQKAVSELSENDNFYILTHENPDGDTLGCACALSIALNRMGKQTKILCSDDIPDKYKFMFDNIDERNFNPSYIITVDVSNKSLLGDKLKEYENKVDLCIDHHVSNSDYAKYTLVNSSVASASEIIYNIINALGIEIDKEIAKCIYTGITTDTGCFKYSNVRPSTHMKAAYLMTTGIDTSAINRLMFDNKSKSSIILQGLAISTLKTYLNDKCAIMYITKEMIDSCSATNSDIDGIVSISRQIEGILVGILIKEKDKNLYKVSVRTDESINACHICEQFGGGGHPVAAGCTINNDDSLENVIKSIVEVVGKELS